MIYSMTAFARRADQNQWGTAVWEMRSVNHRYLELVLRLPESLRELESSLREHIRHAIQRGKIECSLKYQPRAENVANFTIDGVLVKHLAKATKQVQSFFDATAPVNVMDVLAWPNVLQLAEADMQPIHALLLKLFDDTLQDFLKARAQEGKAISQIIEDRLNKVLQEVAKIKPRLPAILEHQRKKIIERLEEITTQVNSERVEQEIVLLAQKMDVAEELERIEIHAHEAQRTLHESGAVGRRLDFLMQELNREANTLAAKSIDIETSAAAVELKVLIEQMREQIQNVE